MGRKRKNQLPMSPEEMMFKLKERMKSIERENALLTDRCASLEHELQKKIANIECLEGGAKPYKERTLVLSRELDLRRQEAELSVKQKSDFLETIAKRDAQIATLEADGRRMREEIKTLKAGLPVVPELPHDAELEAQL